MLYILTSGKVITSTTDWALVSLVNTRGRTFYRVRGAVSKCRTSNGRCALHIRVKLLLIISKLMIWEYIDPLDILELRKCFDLHANANYPLSFEWFNIEFKFFSLIQLTCFWWTFIFFSSFNQNMRVWPVWPTQAACISFNNFHVKISISGQILCLS